MTSRRSVRFQLTLWYLAVLAGGMMLFATGTWFMLRQNLMENRVRNLDQRLAALGTFLSMESRGDDLPAVREEAREYSTGLQEGHGLRVTQPDGTLILEKTPASGSVLQRRKRVEVRGIPLDVELLLPLSDFQRTMSTLAWVMVTVFPLVMGVAVWGGWWLARRALKPVGAMTADAHAINASDLSARLSVPGTQDELKELAESWNEMLGRIEASVRSVSRFTADAAHELRTPVTVIRTSAELALRHRRSPESYEQTLTSIQTETEGMTELLERLLLLARGDAGQWHFELEMVFADDVLRRLRTIISSLAESKGIHVGFQISEQSAAIWGDESAVRRLVMILADNAIKYTPPGGKVVVALRIQDGRCVIEVTDSGCGIAVEQLPYVFDRFYRADSARTAGMGVGLGLAIARTIVEAHHGRIEVTSTSGIGSCFRVLLPSALPQAPAPGEFPVLVRLV